MQFSARYANHVKWGSIVVCLIGIILITRSLPIDAIVTRLQDVTTQLGPWGAVVFGFLYLISAVLFVPGAALTLAAGAIFGPGWGTFIVSVSSTAAAAVAFLIARYVARERVAAYARRHPAFAAIDEAIGKEGARIVALLRLSPVIPFNLSNYLYGLTSIPFKTYVLVSWLFMLPGTFMYVYLGHLGKVGIATATGAERTRTPEEWAMLVIGLLATLAVTIYISRLARRAIVNHMQVSEIRENEDMRTEEVSSSECNRRTWPIGATVMPFVALVILSAGVYSCTHREAIARLFGPPKVRMQESYGNDGGTLRFDHSRYDHLLNAYVDSDGWVDYAGLRTRIEELDAYLQQLSSVDLEALTRDERLALLINAYNAFTLRLILDYYPLASIKDIPAPQRWDARRWNVGGHVWSLNEIEHEQIRPRFVEPRVHFALVCAAIGCPKLRNEAYRGDLLDKQLEDQARYVHAHHRWFQFDQERNVVYLTRLYDWYRGDFEQISGSVLDFAARYVVALKKALDAGQQPTIEWLPYDWTLNDKRNRP